MPERPRIVLFYLLLFLVALAAVVFAVTLMSRPAAQSVPSTTQADQEVCSHVSPGAIQPLGDWRDPAVAQIAYTQASDYIRSAYTAASEATMPYNATVEQASATAGAWRHLEAVCGAVNASQGER